MGEVDFVVCNRVDPKRRFVLKFEKLEEGVWRSLQDPNPTLVQEIGFEIREKGKGKKKEYEAWHFDWSGEGTGEVRQDEYYFIGAWFPSKTPQDAGFICLDYCMKVMGVEQ